MVDTIVIVPDFLRRLLWLGVVSKLDKIDQHEHLVALGLHIQQ